MKICFVGNASSTHIHKWVNWFVDRGHDVYLASAFKYTDTNLKIRYISPKKQIPENQAGENFNLIKVATYISLFSTLRKFLKNEDIDILHGHYILGHGTVTSTVSFSPKILSIWGDDIASAPDKHPFLIKYALKRATIIHAQDPLVKTKIQKIINRYDKIFVMPWGVNLDIFSPNQRAPDLRRKFQQLPGPIIIILRGMERRYYKILSAAIDKIIHKIPDVNFILLKSELFKNKFEDNKNVTLIDWIDRKDVPQYLASSDLFIDPYIPHRPNEIGHTYGMALLEAMASGIATLVAERPTITYLKGDERWYFGEYYKAENSENLYKKAIALLNDANRRREMITKNLEIVRKKFDANKNMKKIEGLYTDLLTNRDSK